MSDFFCCLPFTRLSIDREVATPCCRGWIDKFIYFDDNVGPISVWNCQEMQALRRTILDNSYKFCRNCPKYRARLSVGVQEEWYKEVMDFGPSMVMISNDYACNLSCYICAYKLQKARRRKGVDREALEIQKYIVWSFRSSLKLLAFSTRGDPFAEHSSHQSLLQWLTIREYPKLKLVLFTNGLLLPKFWSQSEHLTAGLINRIDVSVDSAIKETYERIRTPGRWEQIQQALKFLSKKREKFDFSLVLHITAFSWNWREILQFIEMARKFGATTVIQVLHDAEGTIPASLYRKLAVHTPSHPECKQFQEMIASVRSKSDVNVLLAQYPMRCYED